MYVRDIMNQPVHTCRISDSASCAAQLMWDHDCGIAPIVGDDGRLAGVVTDRDLCMASFFQHKSLDDIPLLDVMTADVLTCTPDDLILQVEYLLGKHRLHRLPVVDDGGVLVGMLSLADMARHVPNKARRQHDPEREELIEALRSISEPRGNGLSVVEH